MTTDITFIYTLTDPRDGCVRYVGKSDDPLRRLRTHIRDSISGKTKGHKCNWIMNLHAEGLEPILTVVEAVKVSEWQERERYWIAQYSNLTNIMPGGYGPIFFTEESRRENGVRAKKLWENPDYRAHMQEIHRERMNRPESKEFFSALFKGKKQKPEHVEKRNASRRKNGHMVRTQFQNDAQSKRMCIQWETHVMTEKELAHMKQLGSEEAKAQRRAEWAALTPEQQKHKLRGGQAYNDSIRAWKQFRLLWESSALGHS